MPESQSLYDMLGLSTESGDAIVQDVFDRLRAAHTMSDALKSICEKYDPESVLAGIRFEFAMNECKQVIAEKKKKNLVIPSMN